MPGGAIGQDDIEFLVTTVSPWVARRSGSCPRSSGLAVADKPVPCRPRRGDRQRAAARGNPEESGRGRIARHGGGFEGHG